MVAADDRPARENGEVAARRAVGRMGEMLFQRRKHRPEATVHLLQHHHIGPRIDDRLRRAGGVRVARSEEHTSELQSLMRNSYAVFCLKKTIKCTDKHKHK